LWTPISCCAPGLLSYSYYFAYIPPIICSQDRLLIKAEVYLGFSRTIIRNLAVPRHFVSYLVFFSSIRVDPGPTNRGPSSSLTLKIRTPVANTRKLRSIGQMPVVIVLNIFCLHITVSIIIIIIIMCVSNDYAI
jgi:hypothetical protein